MNDPCQKTEVFPVGVDSAADVKRLPSRPDFQSITTQFQIFAFIVYLERELIHYKKVEFNARYKKHFFDTAHYIRPVHGIEEKPWDWAVRRLKKDVADNLRKNIDTRTCFKYDMNFFLVKSCFTTGQRRVQPGTVHLYQVGAVQMMLYFVSPLNARRIRRQEKLFPEKEQYRYSKRTLHPNQAYWIPENTLYVVYAINKCYFSMHILRADEVDRLPFKSKNPLLEAPTKRPACLFQRPLKTPRIEEEDPVLMELESGERVTESMMTMDQGSMPPPPPPPPQIITLKTIPLERSVQVVTPDVRRWFQTQFQYREYGEPPKKCQALSTEEPMDLTFKPAETTTEQPTAETTTEQPTADYFEQPTPELSEQPTPELFEQTEQPTAKLLETNPTYLIFDFQDFELEDTYDQTAEAELFKTFGF